MARLRTAILLLSTIVASAALAGCFGFYEARVPDQHLTQGWSETGSSSGQRWLGLAAEWSVRTYAVTPTDPGPLDDGPYPASLAVMTIDTPGQLDKEDVSQKLDRQLRDNAAEQDLHIQDGSKQNGERTLATGVRSLYFTYDAEIGADSNLFQPGRDARVLGEVWFDEPSRTTVICIGLAQIQGGGAGGQYFVDRTHWARIVADQAGSIDGHTGSDGLVYNVWSHDP